MPSQEDSASESASCSSASSSSSLDALLAQDDSYPASQMTAHRVIYGRNVIQVPLKEHTTNEYVNLVLSQLEFDAMAVHVPQYEELPPEELLDMITQLVKEQEVKKRQRLSSCGSVPSNEPTATGASASDSLSAFQNRLLELEYERKRLHTKLKDSKALHNDLREENAALRVQMRELEAQSRDVNELLQENELLRHKTQHFGGNVAKLKKVVAVTLDELKALKRELQVVKQEVKDDQDEAMLTVEDAMAMVIEDVNAREQVLQQSYVAEKREREVMAEKYYELSGRIRVFCRVRPEKETHSPCLVIPRANNVLIVNSGKEFAFDQVFGPQSTQAEVYAQIEPLIVSFTDGYNACIMAYGQTGSGKTHTMVGNGQGLLEHCANGLMVHANAGVIPRALQHVFAMVTKRQLTYVDTLRVSMVEIYNDQILDLLHEDSTGGGKNTVAKNIADITARDVSSYEQVDAVMRDGNANRNIAATKMNLESSRSHALVFLHLDSQHRETREVRTSTLCLVDLAGSERISRSQVEGDRLRETQHINKSLAALGDVVYALQHKAKHTPYRNSKLTYMLRDMLSGQAKTLLMLQLSPDLIDVDETTCSLQFGARVSQVQMGAVRPSVESGAICKLQEENRAYGAKALALETQLNDLQKQFLHQGEALRTAQSSKEASERQVWRLSERQHEGEVADGLCHENVPLVDPSRPTSPTCSAKSSQSASPITSARSAQPVHSARSAQSSAPAAQQSHTRRSQVSTSSRLSGTARISLAASTPTVSRLQRPEVTSDYEERRKSLSAASRERAVISDLRRKSLSATSASSIVDNQRESQSTPRTRVVSRSTTSRPGRVKEASSLGSRAPLSTAARTRPAGSLTASATARQSTLPSAGSSADNKALRSTTPKTGGGGDMCRSSLTNKTRSSPSLTRGTSAKRSTNSPHSGWK